MRALLVAAVLIIAFAGPLAAQSLRVAVIRAEYSGPEEFRWLSHALEYALTEPLGALAEVSVVRRAAVAQVSERLPKPGDMDVRAIRAELARLLAVDRLLAPSATVERNSAKLSIEVIDPVMGGTKTLTRVVRTTAGGGAPGFPKAYARLLRALPSALGVETSTDERRRLSSPPTDVTDSWKAFSTGWAAWDGRHGDPASAAESFAAAREADPSCVPAWAGEVSALVEAERLRSADSMSAEFMARFPFEPMAYITAAKGLWAMGDTSGALSLSENATKLGVASWPALYQHAWYRVYSGDPGGALPFLDKALAFDRLDAPTHLLRGIALYSLGRGVEGEAEMHEFLRLEPETSLGETANAYLRGDLK